mgnify:CR=1 FL=1
MDEARNKALVGWEWIQRDRVAAIVQVRHLDRVRLAVIERHQKTDIFANALPRRFLHGSLAVGYALGTALLAMIAWQAWIRTTGAWNASNLISATVPWPTWPSYFMVVIGAVLVTLRCGLRALSHAASAVTGRELADMPPPPLTTSSESEHGV